MGKGSSTRIMLLIALAAGAEAFACQRSGSANQVSPTPDDPPNAAAAVQVRMTAQAPAEMAGPPPRAKYEEPQFTLSLAAPPDVTKGSTAVLSVVLVAKPPFHVNEEYPHRFRVITARGLSTPAKTIQRDSAKVTKSRLEMSIPVTLGTDESYRLDGEMGFSVCTDEKCLMEKRPLTIEFGQKS